MNTPLYGRPDGSEPRPVTMNGSGYPSEPYADEAWPEDSEHEPPADEASDEEYDEYGPAEEEQYFYDETADGEQPYFADEAEEEDQSVYADEQDSYNRLKDDLRDEILGELHPTIMQQATGELWHQLPGAPDEAKQIVHETLSRLQPSALADLVRKGGHHILAKAAIGELWVAGRLPAPPWPVGGETIGGASMAGYVPDNLRSEISEYERMTGQKVTPRQLREWGYM